MVQEDSKITINPMTPTEELTLEVTLVVTPVITKEAEADYIEFKDKDLEALIRICMNQPQGQLKIEDLEKIEDLCILSGDVITEDFSEDRWSDYERWYYDEVTESVAKDWSELRYLKNLKRLVLIDCAIKDIQFLLECPKLEFLSIEDNRIKDYTPLQELTSLKQLYLGLYYEVNELNFLRDLKLENSDIYWEYVYYPYELTKDDITVGISSGNLVNEGFVVFDGNSVYTVKTEWGDLAHGTLIQYHLTTNQVEELSNEVTEQMAALWNCDPGDYMNQAIQSLNYYDGSIYYLSYGTNENTAAPLEEGYYYGDPLYGIIRLSDDGEEKALLTTEVFQYMCVARDHIYALNEKNEFVQMSLEGKERQLVTEKACTFIYVNEDAIYYLTKKEGNLVKINHDTKQQEVMLQGDIKNPIIEGNYIFYMDNNSHVYRYDVTSKETICLYDKPIFCYNVDQESVYLSSLEEDLFMRVDHDGDNIVIISHEFTNNIQMLGDYLFLGWYPNLYSIKKDGTEMNDFVTYY